MSETTVRRAMVIMAHPDDGDFIAAGTMAKWAKEGWEVVLVVVTDGSRGSEDPNLTPEKLREIREAEQRAAAKTLGVSDVVFLGYEDGALEDSTSVRRDLVRLIRQHRPLRVIAQDPTHRWSGQSYINHPDHMAAGNAALVAVYPLARNRPSFRELLAEGLEPFSVPELYLAGTSVPDCWIDVGDTLELKVAALREHRSQIGDWDVEAQMKEWAHGTADGHDMEYAESFKYFKLG